MEDAALLQEYIRNGCEPAFTALVDRYIGLVYSAALRQVRDPHLAEDVAQAVFIILARKAGRLSRQTVLAGWLLQTARYTSNTQIRAAIRRSEREQEAFMQSTLTEPSAGVWQQLAPLLDEAMASLGDVDRNVLALRYFENNTAGEISRALQMNEQAVHKRAARAIEKLRKFFAHRGITTSRETIAEAISAYSVQTVPAALAKTISVAAITKGAAATPSALTLVKGGLRIMTWTKTKTAVVFGAAAILALSGTTVAVKTVFFPTIKDAYFEPNYWHFQHLPTGLFSLRRSHFDSPSTGVDYSGEGSSPSGDHVTRLMGRNRSFAQLVARVYNCSTFQVVLPDKVPTEHFDYLSTILDTNTFQRFETAIKKKLGYVASWQQHDTEVFLITAQTPHPSGLKPVNPANKSTIRQDPAGQLEFRNRAPWSIRDLMQSLADVPVLDQTGLDGAFDFELNCTREDFADHNWDKVKQALDQLGLELVTTNMPMQMLVVDKMK